MNTCLSKFSFLTLDLSSEGNKKNSESTLDNKFWFTGINSGIFKDWSQNQTLPGGRIAFSAFCFCKSIAEWSSTIQSSYMQRTTMFNKDTVFRPFFSKNWDWLDKECFKFTLTQLSLHFISFLRSLRFAFRFASYCLVFPRIASYCLVQPLSLLVLSFMHSHYMFVFSLLDLAARISWYEKKKVPTWHWNANKRREQNVKPKNSHKKRILLYFLIFCVFSVFFCCVFSAFFLVLPCWFQQK